jgi:predicted tellurium resistance membrane protein TerC
MQELFTAENLVALVTLAALEIVLGIDNIVFISILTGKLPEAQQPKARTLGLALAMLMRVGLLFAIRSVMGLTAPLISEEARATLASCFVLAPLAKLDPSGRDLILLAGGLFLVAKATFEIHDKLEGGEHGGKAPKAASFGAVIVQIMLLDLVFSLDSVITAVGMAKSIAVMVAAVVIAVAVMMIFAGRVSGFIERHPTMKMLALAFLLLIGVMLIAEGCKQHVNKGYIYFAMAFSLAVELLNMRLRKVAEPVHLRHSTLEKPR